MIAHMLEDPRFSFDEPEWSYMRRGQTLYLFQHGDPLCVMFVAKPLGDIQCLSRFHVLLFRDLALGTSYWSEELRGAKDGHVACLGMFSSPDKAHTHARRLEFERSFRAYELPVVEAMMLASLETDDRGRTVLEEHDEPFEARADFEDGEVRLTRRVRKVGKWRDIKIYGHVYYDDIGRDLTIFQMPVSKAPNQVLLGGSPSLPEKPKKLRNSFLQRLKPTV